MSERRSTNGYDGTRAHTHKHTVLLLQLRDKDLEKKRQEETILKRWRDKKPCLPTSPAPLQGISAPPAGHL